MKNKKQSVFEWSIYLFIIMMILFFFINPKEASSAALEGFDLWLRNVMPALFPFFVISTLMVNLRIMNLLQPYFEPLMRKVFGISGGGAFGYLVSIFSGYPVGTKTICEMYQKKDIKKREATVLLSLCSNAGPVFVISTIGAMFYKNINIAIILITVNYLSAFIVGWIYSKIYRSEKRGINNIAAKAEQEPIHYAQAFTRAVTSSVSSIINVGAFIVFFSVIIQMIVSIGLIDKGAANSGILNIRILSSSFITSILELTAGTKAFSGWADVNQVLSVSFSAMAIGFGGLCVFFQSVSFMSETDLSVKTFFLGKIMQSGIAFVLGYAISRFAIKTNITTFNPAGFKMVAGYDWIIFILYMLVLIALSAAAKMKMIKRKQK